MAKYRKKCDGDCLDCKYPDCRVPAVMITIENEMTGGGVKTPYISWGRTGDEKKSMGKNCIS